MKRYFPILPQVIRLKKIYQIEPRPSTFSPIHLAEDGFCFSGKTFGSINPEIDQAVMSF